MPLEQSESKGALQRNIVTEITEGKSPAQAAAIGYSVQNTDDYVPCSVSVMPESVSLQTINEENRKYWKQ